jgi:hypothetical protein
VARSSLAFVLALTTACGGSGAGSGGNGKPVTDGDGIADRGERGANEDGSEDEGQSSSDPCADQSCFRCGDGICPKGFYCDEKAGACSWLPECAGEATCSCVKQGAGDGCSCEEKSGGVYARCE